MKIEKAEIQNSPFIGLFSLVTDSFVLHPPSLGQAALSSLSLLSENLYPFTISGTNLLSIFSLANNNGIIVNNLATKEEIEFLESKKINVLQLKTLKTIGNLCSVNNSKGLISPELAEFQEQIESHLNVKLLKTAIGETVLTGSASCLSDKGAIISPLVTENQLNKIKEFLEIEVIPSSINYGDAFPKTGLLLNSKTVLIGSNTSSIELAKIFDAFGGN